MNITIRQAAAKDALAISKIYASSWKTAYTGIIPQTYLDELKEDFWVKSFEEWLTSPSFHADIIYAEGIPAGCIGYGKSRDSGFSDWGEINSLYIAPTFCRRGYGKALLSSAFNTLKKEGYTDCYLWVLSENQNAQHFYEINGFIQTTDTYAIELMGKQLVDLRYVRRL